MSERLDDWMDGYVAAWAGNDPEMISALFTPDAVYDPQTAEGERHGIEEIIEFWLEIDDQEDNWDFEWLPLIENDDLAVITGATTYFDPAATIRNLFVIRFAPDGRCRDFTEWYIEEDES
ncbi:MAG TPA: nuclear transport factor 2 family protein [Acidimicrobiia bacterium]|nr:nuclear transport factor 2 family protein [Acidimicrobiia bacterium]